MKLFCFHYMTVKHLLRIKYPDILDILKTGCHLRIIWQKLEVERTSIHILKEILSCRVTQMAVMFYWENLSTHSMLHS